ncbi:hypothetical protein [Stenotrophomonas sp. BIGb0135]|uniref:hypothetical protein n=1 Tax=Stenotrophomonas sp. BIGb0135 TaxID=2940620 RepID=UPI002169BEF6|nr:hypothetical protein [Stenotrophomonas sp. BIGb0135]MCS4233101.1 hypothetical protein [Stenotrophomonas sp. BIGb0135]
MGLCVALTENGTIVPTGQPVAECSGYVLLSGAEVSTVALIAQAFEIPDKEVLATWAAGPFGLIVFLFVVARVAGSVAAVFHKA